jgi:hypothetical protein
MAAMSAMHISLLHIDNIMQLLVTIATSCPMLTFCMNASFAERHGRASSLSSVYRIYYASDVNIVMLAQLVEALCYRQVD